MNSKICLALIFFFTSSVVIANSLPAILRVIQKEPADLNDIKELVHYRWYEKALQALQKYPAEDEEVLNLKAKVLMGLKQYDEALALFQDLAHHASSSKIREESLLKEAIVLARLQRYSEALQKYCQLLSRGRRSYKHKELTWRAFKTAIEAKDYEEALRLLKNLSGPEVFWWQGWCRFQMGDVRTALRSWEKISTRQPPVRVSRRRKRRKSHGKVAVRGFPPQVLYWKAMARERLKEKGAAEKYLNELVEKYPFSYYSVLALSYLYPDENDFHQALKRIWSENSSGTFLGTYPKNYQAEIERESKKRGLDPNLVFALIWQESRFRENVVSPTGAIGLMQLMPQTALQVVAASNTKRFEPESILEPDVNVQVGCLYVKFLENLFLGHIPYAVAAYNAGEEAVSRWLSSREQDPVEVFVEEIPYEETQNYTKKVLTSYWMYRWLYEGRLPERFVPNSASAP